jgi:hypothetical protein
MASMPKRARPSRPSAPRKPSKPSKRPKQSTKLVPVLARLDPGQAAALRQEAKLRRAANGGGRVDVGEVIREAISVWIAIRPGQRAIIRAVAANQDLTRPEVLRKALDAWITSLEPNKG